jgi:hypothetical protein
LLFGHSQTFISVEGRRTNSFIAGCNIPEYVRSHKKERLNMRRTPLVKYQIRLNLIDLTVEYVKEVSEGCVEVEDEGRNDLLKMMAIYRADTVRIMNGQPGDMDYLCEQLKVGIRLAGSLMQKIQDEESQSLIGWFYGCSPKNNIQFWYSLLCATAHELAASITEVESQYPEWKWLFDQERKDYARITAQWQREDEELNDKGRATQETAKRRFETPNGSECEECG